MAAFAGADQARVDRLCQAVAWATANEQTFGRLTRMSVEESGMGSVEGVPARRWKIMGILRDALRTRSVGVIEELPEKGIVKYAKPAGVIAGVLPVTNPLVTMVNMAINAIKCKDAVIFHRTRSAGTRRSKSRACCARLWPGRGRPKISSSASRSRASRWRRS
jgi:sulfoacetaldehyde dehydrogenase